MRKKSKHQSKFISFLMITILIIGGTQFSVFADFSPQQIENYDFRQKNRLEDGKVTNLSINNKSINKDKLKPVSPSNWGTDGIGLEVSESSVQIEFDCANGEIKQKLMMNQKGNFTASGFYTRRIPGALRVDLQPKPQAANYQGKISGNRMTLKITLTETKEVVGEFILKRNQTPRIRGCR